MKFRTHLDDLLPVPTALLGCFADDGGEGGGGDGGADGGADGGNGADAAAGGGGNAPEWLGEVQDESLRSALSGFDSRDKALEAIGYQAPDWRDGIEDEKLQSHAKRFPSVADMAKSNMELISERDRLKNTAIVPPGEDASEEDIAAYHQKLGAPETPDGYEFLKPSEGEELTEHEQQSRQAWAERFHKLGVPIETAEQIVSDFREDMANGSKVVAEQDEKYAEQSAANLKREWGQDYDRNDKLSNETAPKLLGDDFAEFSKLTDKNDRLIGDNPMFKRMFARIGLEMQEGSLGAVSDDERSGLEEEIRTLTKQIGEAQASGETKRANQLYQREQALRAKMGNRPIVGARGRAA